MVDAMGHLAFGLAFAIPAWFVWRDRISVAFIALTVLTAPLPDVDKYVNKLFPSVIHHHGVTHTVVFVVAVSLVAGAVAATVFRDPINEWLRYDRFDASGLFAFSFGAFLLGGLSHLFADMLSAPDISTPIEPFWPLFDKPWSVDVLWYNSPWWNLGFLVVVLAVHLTIAYVFEPIEHPYQTHRVHRSE